MLHMMEEAHVWHSAPLVSPSINQTSMGLSSAAADANAAAGFGLLAETFYSGIKEESTAAALLLRRHYIRKQC